MSRVISGAEFTRAVRRSGLGNKGVADLLGVKLTTINEYMNHGVRPIRTELVLDKLGPYLEQGNPLQAFSDVALIAELARRLDAATTQRGGEVTDESPSVDDPGKHGGSNGGRVRGTGSAEPPQ